MREADRPNTLLNYLNSKKIKSTRPDIDLAISEEKIELKSELKKHAWSSEKREPMNYKNFTRPLQRQ